MPNIPAGTYKIGTAGGPSRDFSSIAAFIVALQANGGVLANGTGAGNGGHYVGECYNDGEFSNGATITGITATAAATLKITVAAGHSFQDNVNVRTNPLRYDRSKGVGILFAGSYAAAFMYNCNYLTIERLQIKSTDLNGRPIDCQGGTNVTVRSILAESISSISAGIYIGYDPSCKAVNCTVISHGAGYGFLAGGNALVLDCTAIRSNTGTNGTGLCSSYGGVFRGCAVFGFATPYSFASGSAATGSKNVTDQASGLPGTTNVYNAVLANAIESNADATPDGRAKAGGPLAGVGYYDVTNAPTDITGTARANPPTAGAWELSGSTTTTKIYPGAGGATASGAAALARAKTFNASGGAQSAGSPALAKVKVFPSSGGASSSGSAGISKTRTWIPGGGAIAAGIAAAMVLQCFAAVASGGAVSGGSALRSTSKSVVSVGGGVAASAASVARTKVFASSGGALAGGVVSFSRVKAFAGSGGASAAGSATLSGTHAYLWSGGGIAAGSASVSRATVFAGSGGSVSAGAASVSRVKVFAGSGGALAGGSASVSRAKTFAGSGGASAAGTAAPQKIKVYPTSGGALAGGSAPYSFGLQNTYQYFAAGGGVSSGAAFSRVLLNYPYSSSGGGTSGGVASCSRVVVRSYGGSGGGVFSSLSLQSWSSVHRYSGMGGAVFSSRLLLARTFCRFTSGGATGGGAATARVVGVHAGIIPVLKGFGSTSYFPDPGSVQTGFVDYGSPSREYFP